MTAKVLPWSFPPVRFNLSVDNNEVEFDDPDVDLEESCRPQFSDIKKVTGFLDKELEASGFTRKDQDDMEKVQIDLSLIT